MKLANIFTDHAVLQRHAPIAVWGECSGGKVVCTLEKDGRTLAAAATAASAGRFLLRLPPLPAGGPYILRAAAEGEKSEVVLEDIYIGEVWLASGQSNMAFTIANIGKYKEAALTAANRPQVRMFTVANSVGYEKNLSAGGHSPNNSEEHSSGEDVRGQWLAADSETTEMFSAVGYFFAAKLADVLHCAIGIINSSWGGTDVRAWTSREMLLTNPGNREIILRKEAELYRPENWEVSAAERQSRQQQENARLLAELCGDPDNLGEHDGWHTPEYNDQGWPDINVPGNWKNQGRPENGVLWYRCRIELPADWAGCDLVLHPGALDKLDVTYFNGEKIGATGSGYEQTHWNVARHYPVPGRLVRPGENTIAVRVNSFAYDGGMIGMDQLRITRADDRKASVPLPKIWRARFEKTFKPAEPSLFNEQALIWGVNDQNTPGILFRHMIAPLIPYSLRGVIWYQGEHNGSEPHLYRRMILELIRDWRFRWGEDFPFIQVQLPGCGAVADYDGTASWALLREAQSECRSALNGVVVSIDVGDADDIHPHNKQPVGERLAGWALAQVYGKAGDFLHPYFQHLTPENGTLRVHFANAAAGLTTRDGRPPATVVIAGDDREFHPATAEIDGASLVVSSPAVPAPKAVRYAWAASPDNANLTGNNGLPVEPFRSDRW